MFATRTPIFLLAAAVAASSCSNPGSSGPDPVADTPDAAAAPDAAPDVEPDAAPDAAPDVEPGPDPRPYFSTEARVRIVEQQPEAGQPQSHELSIFFWTRADQVLHEQTDASGSCVYLRYEPLPPCNPSCEAGEVCTRDGVCEPGKQRLSAGEVTISGLVEPVSVTPDDGAWYAQPELPDDLFAAGEPITVSAAGSELPAFEAEVTGVGDMETAWGSSLTLADGQDDVVTWVPQGDGATVELIIQTGWHGAPPPDVIWCSAPDADGRIVIPRAFVEQYPPAGGIGLFPNPSYIRRVDRRYVETAGGVVEVLVASERTFSIVH